MDESARAESLVFTPASTRILLSGDQPIMRSALRLMIETRPGLQVSFETANSPDDVGRVNAREIDLAVLDFNLNDTSEGRMRLLREIVGALHGAPTLILTTEPMFEACQRAFEYGVKGLLLKENTQYDIFGAIARVRRGEVWLVGPTLAKMFADSLVQKRTGPEDERISRLTKREREIIRVAARGVTNRQIAQQLCISEATVRHHLSAIFDKLGVPTRSALIVFAYCYHLADQPTPDVDWIAQIASGDRAGDSSSSSAPLRR
jgi:DNA-binding NarL/FixJ family response regulator